MQTKYQYIFGPVYSWRLGVSVGIDLLSGDHKICNFSCEYCQLGPTKDYQAARKEFVSTEKVLQEIRAFPEKVFDFYTFSSSGEPTLASNLGDVISRLKNFYPEKKVAVITNSALIHQKDVQSDLMPADYVLAKVDACDEASLKKINAPVENIRFSKIWEGIKNFGQIFEGKLALQIMFVENNRELAVKIAKIAQLINPQEIQINTPLRPCSSKPLPENELDDIKKEFVALGLDCKTVYEAKRQEIRPVSVQATQKRHGKMSFSEEKK